MPEIEIRPTFLSQAPALGEIHAASFGDAAWSLQQIEGSLALNTTQGWAAFEGDRMLGFILCQILPSLTEILTFAVLPDAQRRRIGERLIKRLLESMPQNDGARIILEVAADNHAACALYEKHGFRKSGIRPNYYRRPEISVDAILYERVLSEQ